LLMFCSTLYLPPVLIFCFSSFVIQVKPAPSSITQCSKQRWHPDEDDEEFTANDDEG
jgi:hypothetical protein